MNQVKVYLDGLPIKTFRISDSMFFQSSTKHSEVRLEMSNIGKTEIPHAPCLHSGSFLF